jgi:hypothetical protein
MKRVKSAILACFLLLAFSSPFAAPQSAEKSLDVLKVLSNQVQGKVGATEELSKEEQAAHLSDYKSEVEHRNWKREFIQKSWHWHLWSTALLFILVMAIICFGLYITYLQFQKDYGLAEKRLRNSMTAKAVAAVKAGGGEDSADGSVATRSSSLKFDASGLEITSQVIGLLVLALSLAFFYLYVSRVYPMQTDELTHLQEKSKEEPKPRDKQ